MRFKKNVDKTSNSGQYYAPKKSGTPLSPKPLPQHLKNFHEVSIFFFLKSKKEKKTLLTNMLFSRRKSPREYV